MTAFEIAGQEVEAGTRRKITINLAPLYDFTPTGIPVEVIRGREEGPVLFVSAAIHGDEINGVNIIHRLLRSKRLSKLKGTLIAVPIVNVFGFNTKNRYLPDRRDLNRSFPGSEDGSLAAQVAHIFMREIVTKSNYGIDLHTGAIHRTNLPQIRGCFKDPHTKELAERFGAPVLINSDLRDGSLREAAQEHNVPILLYEGGEALRFDEHATRVGLRGILRVMEAIGMIAPKAETTKVQTPVLAKDSYWLRAPYSGLLQTRTKLGMRVKKDQLLATISDPFATHSFDIRAKQEGIVIGMSHLPLFNKGDAVMHIATFEDAKSIAEFELLPNQTETYVT